MRIDGELQELDGTPICKVSSLSLERWLGEHRKPTAIPLPPKTLEPKDILGFGIADREAAKRLELDKSYQIVAEGWLYEIAQVSGDVGVGFQGLLMARRQSKHSSEQTSHAP